MPLGVDKVRPSLLREQVVDLLHEAIREMRLVPGERITERQLVESTGVSRATAREALRHLAAEGFAIAVPQRGVVVASPSRKEVMDIYQVRAVLEGLAGRLCARRATKADVVLLRERLVALQAVLLDDSASTVDRLAAKASFYNVLFTIADNTTLVAALAPLQAKITFLRATSMAQPGRGALAAKEVKAIVDAIARRDETAAFDACVRHVERAAETVMQALDDDDGPALDS
jgi:DNA-binding GntR family transcriptional regulator